LFKLSVDRNVLSSSFFYLLLLLLFYYFFIFIYACGAVAPTWAMSSSCLRFVDHTHNDTPQLVGLLWTSDQLIADKKCVLE